MTVTTRKVAEESANRLVIGMELTRPRWQVLGVALVLLPLLALMRDC